jgi:hypothetical protein
MIDEHIILIEFGSNWFNAIDGFNSKKNFEKEILINWHVQDKWYNGKESSR